LLTGNITGKLGHMVGAKWRETNYVHEYAQHRKQNSPAQQKALDHFLTSQPYMLWWASQYGAIYPIDYGNATPYEWCCSHNKAFIAGEGQDWSLFGKGMGHDTWRLTIQSFSISAAGLLKVTVRDPVPNWAALGRIVYATAFSPDGHIGPVYSSTTASTVFSWANMGNLTGTWKVMAVLSYLINDKRHYGNPVVVTYVKVKEGSDG